MSFLRQRGVCPITGNTRPVFANNSSLFCCCKRPVQPGVNPFTLQLAGIQVHTIISYDSKHKQLVCLLFSTDAAFAFDLLPYNGYHPRQSYRGEDSGESKEGIVPTNPRKKLKRMNVVFIRFCCAVRNHYYYYTAVVPNCSVWSRISVATNKSIII